MSDDLPEDPHAGKRVKRYRNPDGTITESDLSAAEELDLHSKGLWMGETEPAGVEDDGTIVQRESPVDSEKDRE